jgi:FSR family fosmidomycin resistance protein-like MFS transporter
MGISASMFHVPAPVMIKQISGARVGKGMSFFMMGGEIARSVGPMVILGGISLWSLEGTYKLIPFGLLASVILFYKFKNIKISHEIKLKTETSAKSTLRKYLPLFGLITGMTFFNSIMKGALSAFLPTYLTAKGDSLWYAGISLSVLQLTGAIGTFLAGSVSDKIGRKKVLIISALINPILLIIFLYSTGPFSLFILILLGFFLFAFTPVIMAIVNEVKSEFPAFLNGIYMTINFFTGAVTVYLVGIAADIFYLENTFLFTAFLGFLSVPFIIRLKK